MRRQGVSVDSVLNMMKEQGAKAKLVVLDASRRNPYERRFRSYSHGLAPISRARQCADPVTSASPGKVVDDGKGEHSVLVGELLANLCKSQGGTVESIFNKTRVAISRASEGEQVPTVSSSLLEDVRFSDNRRLERFRAKWIPSPGGGGLRSDSVRVRKGGVG